MYEQATAASPFLAQSASASGSVWLPALNVICDGPISPALLQTASLCGLDCVAIPPTSLLSNAALSGAVVWAVVEDSDAEWVMLLRERHREEAFPLVLQTTLASLDAVDAVAVGLQNCSVVAAPDERDILATLAGQLRRAQSAVHAPLDTVRDRKSVV